MFLYGTGVLLCKGIYGKANGSGFLIANRRVRFTNLWSEDKCQNSSDYQCQEYQQHDHKILQESKNKTIQFNLRQYLSATNEESQEYNATIIVQKIASKLSTRKNTVNPDEHYQKFHPRPKLQKFNSDKHPFT